MAVQRTAAHTNTHSTNEALKHVYDQRTKRHHLLHFTAYNKTLHLQPVSRDARLE